MLLLSLIYKLAGLGPFFKNRKRILVERVSQLNFSRNTLGSTFRNSKWYNYVKTNLTKSRLQQVKRMCIFFILITFVLLLLKIAITSNFNIELIFMNLKTWLVTGKFILGYVFTFMVNVYKFIYNGIIYMFMGETNKNVNNDNTNSSDTVIINKASEVTKNDNNTDDSKLLLIKSLYETQNNICKLDHGKCISNLRTLTNDNSLLSYSVSTQDLELKTLEMYTNVDIMWTRMQNNNKYKKTNNGILKTMLDPKYQSFHMCKEAGVDDSVINIVLSSEYSELKPNSNKTELDTFNEFVKDANNTNKTQRVLFKNTVLHNQTLKSMNWVTNTKKLITDFASTFSAKENNIWVANHLIQNSNKSDFIKNIINIYGDYSDVNKNNTSKKFIKNQTQDSLPSNIDFIKLYEESFFWFLKHVEFFDSTDSKLVKLNIKNNKNVLNIDNILNEFLFLSTKLKNNNIFLKNDISGDFLDAGVKNFIQDSFYQILDKELFNRDTITRIHNIVSSKTDDKSTYYYYKLSNYNLLLLSDLPDNCENFTTDWEVIKKVIKNQPKINIHTIDIIERENLKNYYRLLVYLIKLNNQNNK